MIITDEHCIALAMICGKRVTVRQDGNTGKITVHTLKMRVVFEQLQRIYHVRFEDGSIFRIPQAKFQLEAQSKLLELSKAMGKS